jgi:hypothetical protein
VDNIVYRGTKKSTHNLKQVGKTYSKIQVPNLNDKAYKKMLKNMSMFSLDSPNSGLVQSKTVTSCKNTKPKKVEVSKGKKKTAGNTR